MSFCRHPAYRCGLLLLPVLLVLGIGATARGVVHQVVMGADLRFHPDPVTVAVGDSIDWVNEASFDHTSTSGTPNCVADGIWNSGIVLPGHHWGRSFHTTGPFPYFCEIHCSFGMVGSVVVLPLTPAVPTTWGEIKAIFRD
jgi:plastocyanin